MGAGQILGGAVAVLAEAPVPPGVDLVPPCSGQYRISARTDLNDPAAQLRDPDHDRAWVAVGVAGTELAVLIGTPRQHGTGVRERGGMVVPGADPGNRPPGRIQSYRVRQRLPGRVHAEREQFPAVSEHDQMPLPRVDHRGLGAIGQWELPSLGEIAIWTGAGGISSLARDSAPPGEHRTGWVTAAEKALPAPR